MVPLILLSNLRLGVFWATGQRTITGTISWKNNIWQKLWKNNADSDQWNWRQMQSLFQKRGSRRILNSWRKGLPKITDICYVCPLYLCTLYVHYIIFRGHIIIHAFSRVGSTLVQTNNYVIIPCMLSCHLSQHVHYHWWYSLSLLHPNHKENIFSLLLWWYCMGIVFCNIYAIFIKASFNWLHHVQQSEQPVESPDTNIQAKLQPTQLCL